MASIFLFGSVMFYVLLFIAVIVLIVATELEEPNSWLFWTVPITIGLLYIGGNSNAIKSSLVYISENPGQIILYILFYLIAGTIWSFVKWYLYLVDRREYHLKRSYGYDKENYSLNQNKERILNWMLYWPLSAFWMLINRPMKKMFQWIIKTFGAQYQKISDNVFKDLNTKKEK
jgi:hypothetical protein